jgi:hypothetical protein
MDSTHDKTSEMQHDAVSPFQDKLWDLFKGTAIWYGWRVLALKNAGEEIWTVGIDDTYSSMKHQDDEALGDAFDINSADSSLHQVETNQSWQNDPGARQRPRARDRLASICRFAASTTP